MSLKKPKGMIPDLTSEASLGFFASSLLIIGVDEVGRGCLAGPVVAGAAALDQKTLRHLGFGDSGDRPSAPTDHPLFRVRDSKLIAEKDREPLSKALLKGGVLASAIAEASVAEIGKLKMQTKKNH